MMKRLLGKAGVMLLLIGCMLIGSLSFSMPVSAASKYTVSDIQADGSLKTIGGFEDFYQAEAERDSGLFPMISVQNSL